MPIEFCAEPAPGDVVEVTTPIGIRLRTRPAFACEVYDIAAQRSLGIVVGKKLRKTRAANHMWIKMVFTEFSAGQVMSGWACWGTTCMGLSSRWKA